MSLPAPDLLLPLGLVCVLAFAVETALGFGATLISIALGAFFVEIEELLAALVPLNLAVSSYVAIRYAKAIDTSFLLRQLLPLMAIGLPIGFFVLSTLDASATKRAFGAFLVVVSVLELARMREPGPSTRRPSVWIERGLLVLGGAIHGAFATGGPMAVYVASRAIEDKGAYRATLSALWTVLNLAMVFGYLVRGTLSSSSAGLAVGLAPSIALGMLAGEVLHARVPTRTFRVVVFVLLALAGLMLLARG